MQRFTTLLLSLTLSVISFTAIAQQHMHFATEATYAPLVYLDKDGKISGYEAEIVQAICATLKNASCTFTHQGWDSLVPSLKLGKVDAIFGGLAITDQRAEQVSFTQPLYENSIAFLAEKDKLFTIDKAGLAGKTIGVQIGTTMEHYLREHYKEVNVKSYASLQDALLDIETGRINSVLGDTPVLIAWMKNKPKDKFSLITIPAADTKYFGPGNAIAVNKNNKQLLEQLNTAIDTLKKNGTLAKIAAKYLSMDVVE